MNDKIAKLVKSVKLKLSEDIKGLKNLEKEVSGSEIKRPENWGGFLVKPVEVEFWQGRPNRLHDRIRYQLQNDFSWKIDRLAP
jgi:pyridoxamine 5'-phosphate oxidase